MRAFFFVMSLALATINCGGKTPTPDPHPTKPLNQQTGLTKDPPPPPNDTGEPIKESDKAAIQAIALDQLPVAKISLFGNGEWCTGILVGKQTVVTAAHCFWENHKTHFKPSGVSIYDGTKWVDQQVDPGFYLRSDIDEWDFKDIAVIRLKNPTFINGIAMGKRPDATWEIKPGEKVHSYGYTSRTWTERETIKTAGAKIGAEEKVREWVLPTRYKNAYGGDSGGPLVIKQNNQWILVGVLQGNKGKLYTDEESLIFNWIDPFIKKIQDFDGTEGSPFTTELDIDKKFLKEYPKKP